MIHRTLIALAILFLFIQTTGCHYYIDAVPHFIVSSQEIDLQPPTLKNSNNATETEPRDDRP